PWLFRRYSSRWGGCARSAAASAAARHSHVHRRCYAAAMPSEACHRYLIALGSNVRHVRYGAPREVLRAALAALEQEGLAILAVAPVITTAPLGPSRRRYGNGAALVETALEPDALLALFKRVGRRFGRRVGGKRGSAG